MNGYINVVRNVYKRVYNIDMGNIFSSNEHAENIKEAKKKFKEEQRIIELNMEIKNANNRVKELMDEGRSTDDIGNIIYLEYTNQNVYRHIRNDKVKEYLEKLRRNKYDYEMDTATVLNIGKEDDHNTEISIVYW